MINYEILTTETFSKWLLNLKDKQAVRAINLRIARIREGNLGDFKSVGGGVSELRIFVGKGYRIYFTVQNTEIILLLCAGHKGTQSSDIERAKKLLSEVL